MLCILSRTRLALLVSGLVFLVLLILELSPVDLSRDALPASQKVGQDPVTRPTAQLSASSRLRVLIPASNGDVNLCKTLLTATALGYETPTLIAWNETFNTEGLLAGGSHVAKIYGVLDHLEGLDQSADDDLVLMMDAYDIWFQLRPEVLISRYHAINAKSDERLAKRLGNAFRAEDLRQTIVFGAGKRCAPNQLHTVACYPIPESPLPSDLYGANTDTVMGRNKYTSLRQRYLNSGYVIGPVADVRRMFRRAAEKATAVKDHIDWDNGSHDSDLMYHGSDQSVFNTMLGEQEIQREVMRRRHLSRLQKLVDPARRKPSYIEGTLIDDPLDPSFTHEPMEHKAGKPDEFGIGLDFFSELGQQTVNAEEDGRWINYGENVSEQVKDRHMFDCPSRVTGALVQDVRDSRSPFDGLDGLTADWTGVPLYTNLCLDTIPVMVHHNGDKAARKYAWPRLWLQPHAREFLSQLGHGPSGASLEDDASRGAGAFTVDGSFLDWRELCPVEFDAEIFRDAESKPQHRPLE